MDDLYQQMGREYAGLVQKQTAEIDALKAQNVRLAGDLERMRIVAGEVNDSMARAIVYDWAKLNALIGACDACLKMLLSTADSKSALSAAEDMLRCALADARRP